MTPSGDVQGGACEHEWSPLPRASSLVDHDFVCPKCGDECNAIPAAELARLRAVEAAAAWLIRVEESGEMYYRDGQLTAEAAHAVYALRQALAAQHPTSGEGAS